MITPQTGHYYRTREGFIAKIIHRNSDPPKENLGIRSFNGIKIELRDQSCKFIAVCRLGKDDWMETGECYYTTAGKYAGGKGCNPHGEIVFDYETPHPFDLIEEVHGVKFGE